VTLAAWLLVASAICAACWLVMWRREVRRARLARRADNDVQRLMAQVSNRYRMAVDVAAIHAQCRAQERAGYVAKPFGSYQGGRW
jgi:hypothetical protein